MIQDLKKQRLKIVIWSTAVIQDLPSSIISRDGHFTILQFVTKQIWSQIPDTDMNMGRRWKKYMPSLTLYQRFSTGGNSWRCEMQCLGAAVLWVAAFRGFSTPVGRWWWLEQSRDKSGFASLRVLQYGQLKISRKKRKPVRNACQSGGAACDLAKCDLSTPNHAAAPYLEPYIRKITAAPLTKLCTAIQI